MKTGATAIVTLAMLLTACRRERDATPVPDRPTQRAPMALDPNPPMSANDIDAIVQETRQGHAGRSATNNSNQREGREER